MPLILRRSYRWALLLLLLGQGAGCAVLFQSPDIEFAGVRIIGIGLTSGVAEVELLVDNPNLFGIEVRDIRYRIEVADSPGRWTELAAGVSGAPVTLPRRSQERVRLEVPFQYRGIETALLAWLASGEVPYRIRGEVLARGSGRTALLPFQASGSVGR